MLSFIIIINICKGFKITMLNVAYGVNAHELLSDIYSSFNVSSC